MKVIQEITGRIAAAWALLTFAITFLIIFPFSMIAYLLPEPKATAYLIRISKIWIRSWMFLIGCPIVIKGIENFKKGETYIIVSNHGSFLDPTLTCPFIPGANKTIAKDSFAKVPIFGWFYAKGSVLVNRKSEKSRKESFLKMKKVIALGMHMTIYPEGTRNRTNQPLKPFYKGAFNLAYETGKNILPAIIINSKKALPADKPFFFSPQKLELHFLQPVNVKNQSAEELKRKVFSIMEEYIIQHQRV